MPLTTAENTVADAALARHMPASMVALAIAFSRAASIPVATVATHLNAVLLDVNAKQADPVSWVGSQDWSR